MHVVVLNCLPAILKRWLHLSSFKGLQAFLTAMKLGIEAKQPWLVCNSAVAIWNTYLPNLQQQLFAPLRDLLVSATNMLLNQADTGSLAAQLKALATAAASAAEHTALLAVLAATEQTGGKALQLCCSFCCSACCHCIVDHLRMSLSIFAQKSDQYRQALFCYSGSVAHCT